MDHIATRLPLDVQTFSVIVLLTRDKPQGLVQFRVRAARVRGALVRLKANNQYRQDFFGFPKKPTARLLTVRVSSKYRANLFG